MKYCKSATETHPLLIRYPQHKKLINEIIIAENGVYPPFGEEVALDFDKIVLESKDEHITKGHKSMDMCFCVEDCEQIKTVLVEFKFGCKDPKNLKVRRFA